LPAEAVNGIVTSHLAAGDEHRTASKVFIAHLSFRDATSIHHHSAKSGSNLHVVRRVNPNDALTKSRNERAGPVTSELVDFYVDMMLEKMEHIAVEHQSDMVILTTFVSRRGRPCPTAILATWSTDFVSGRRPGYALTFCAIRVRRTA
jgi:hypothetical protein